MARRPLRIALIGARGIGSAYSGIETYYEELGSRLVARGHTVYAYCRRHATPPDTDFRGVTPIFQPCIRTKHGETFSHTLISTLDVLRRPVDIVQFHALGPSLFAWIPRWMGKKTVNSIRGLDWQREKWGLVARSFLKFGEKMSYRLPDATVVVSQTLQSHYKSRYGFEPTFIPNGVTPEVSPEPREIHELGLQGRDYFLFMGRISPEKGLETLLEAFRRVSGRAKLVIAGGSSYTDVYQQKLMHEAPPEVIFPGRVRGRLKAELYANAAAFVLPSTIEGLSVALLEAMSHGACVVSSDIPENRELVDGVGWTAPGQDPIALAECLTRVLDRPNEARELGRKARARVHEGYTWDQVALRTEELYYQILGVPSIATQAIRAAAMF